MGKKIHNTAQWEGSRETRIPLHFLVGKQHGPPTPENTLAISYN